METEQTLISNDTFTCVRVNTSPPTFKITWSCRNVDVVDIKKIGSIVNRSTDYRAISRQTLNKMRTITSLDANQIVSARSALLKNKIISSFNRMDAHVIRIIPEYEHKGILYVSNTYDFPPLNLLRGILLRRGYSTKSLREIFVNKTNAAKILGTYDMQQYVIAEANDAESSFNQRQIAEIAAANELTFVNYFRSLGIALKDENEIAAEQVAEHGRAIATPDILFLDNVIINGVAVTWLDYKDYIGTNVRFLYMSNLSQAAEYNSRWGVGAIAYHHGAISTMSIPGTLLLDAGTLPIKLCNKDIPTSIRINVVSETKTNTQAQTSQRKKTKNAEK